MKKKLKIIGPVLAILVIAVIAYEVVMPHKAGAKPHLSGIVYTLPGQFTLNLAGDHYATLTVALLLPAAVAGGPADEPVIRSIITDDVTGQPSDALISGKWRTVLEHKILTGINTQTDAVVSRVYFTDLAVQ